MKLLFTCLFGDYDLPKPIKVSLSGWDKVLYTNNKDLKSLDWDVVYKEGDDSDKLLSRKFKILNPHQQYDTTLYVDATFSPIRKLDSLVSPFKSGVALNKHPRAKCLYKEAETVIQKKLDNPEVVQKQIEKYRLEAFPENAGLWRCGIMVRNPKDTEELSQVWWNEIQQGSWRDQISFPYACWKTGITPEMILPGVTTSYFRQSLHKPKPLGNFEIHQFDLTEDINKKIQEVPKNDWVVVGNPGKPLNITENTHLFVSDQLLIFPRWLHDYIQVDQKNKRRWDLQFKHICEVYNAEIKII